MPHKYADSIAPSWKAQKKHTLVRPTAVSRVMRGIAVVNQTIAHAKSPVVLVSHGNMIGLILRYFNAQIGYADWVNLKNPDPFRVTFNSSRVCVERMLETPTTTGR